eukprot:5648760-Pleurochrysis_carterae.AAC.1
MEGRGVIISFWEKTERACALDAQISIFWHGGAYEHIFAVTCARLALGLELLAFCSCSCTFPFVVTDAMSFGSAFASFGFAFGARRTTQFPTFEHSCRLRSWFCDAASRVGVGRLFCCEVAQR